MGITITVAAIQALGIRITVDDFFSVFMPIIYFTLIKLLKIAFKKFISFVNFRLMLEILFKNVGNFISKKDLKNVSMNNIGYIAIINISFNTYYIHSMLE